MPWKAGPIIELGLLNRRLNENCLCLCGNQCRKLHLAFRGKQQCLPVEVINSRNSHQLQWLEIKSAETYWGKHIQNKHTPISSRWSCNHLSFSKMNSTQHFVFLQFLIFQPLSAPSSKAGFLFSALLYATCLHDFDSMSLRNWIIWINWKFMEVFLPYLWHPHIVRCHLFNFLPVLYVFGDS